MKLLGSFCPIEEEYDVFNLLKKLHFFVGKSMLACVENGDSRNLRICQGV